MILSCEGTLQRQAVKCLLCLEMHFTFVDLSYLCTSHRRIVFFVAFLFSGVLEFHVCCIDKLIFQILLKGKSYNNKNNSLTLSICLRDVVCSSAGRLRVCEK